MNSYIPRRIESALRRAAGRSGVAMLTGPRRSGKTHLVRRLFGDTHSYSSLADPALRRLAGTDAGTFLDDHPAPAILDDIEEVPGVVGHLLRGYPKVAEGGRGYVLAGVRTPALAEQIQNSVGELGAELTLLPLSISENPGLCVGAVRDPGTYADWVLRGTFPALHEVPPSEVAPFYASYLHTLIERDARAQANIDKSGEFERLLLLLAERSGMLLNYTSLARRLGVAPNTVKAWVRMLELAGQIYLCPAYPEPLGKRAIKGPRVHILDPGLLCYLGGITTRGQALTGSQAEAVLTGFVGGELLRLMTNEGEPQRLYHWRTVTGEGVDFVFEVDGQVLGVVCTPSTSPHPRLARTLEHFMALLPEQRRGGGLLVCNQEQEGLLGEARVVPVGRFRQL